MVLSSFHSAILACNFNHKLIYNLQLKGILEFEDPSGLSATDKVGNLAPDRQVTYSQIWSQSAPPLSLGFLICQMSGLGQTFKTFLALKFLDSTNQRSRRTLGTAGVCVWANLDI